MNRKLAYIEIGPHGIEHEHCLAAAQALRFKGYELRYVKVSAYQAAVLRDSTANTILVKPHLYVGSAQYTTHYLQRVHGICPPPPLNVPLALRAYYPVQLHQVDYRTFLSQQQYPVFVKPALEPKLFNAGVITTLSAKKGFLDMCHGDTQLLTGDVVDYVSEFRVFVDRDRGMQAMKHYSGDPFELPQRVRIEQMIAAYQSTAPTAYALDVGVLSTGQTMLVEVNDFWALGTYGWDPVPYIDLALARWKELLSQAKT